MIFSKMLIVFCQFKSIVSPLLLARNSAHLSRLPEIFIISLGGNHRTLCSRGQISACSSCLLMLLLGNLLHSLPSCSLERSLLLRTDPVNRPVRADSDGSQSS